MISIRQTNSNSTYNWIFRCGKVCIHITYLMLMMEYGSYGQSFSHMAIVGIIIITKIHSQPDQTTLGD